MSVRHGRRLRRITGITLVLLVVTSAAGCLGLSDEAPATPPAASYEVPQLTDVDPDAPEPGVLRIQGDRVLDHLAERMRWGGSGTFADPYTIHGLELQDTLLVFQDLTRAVTVTHATLDAPPEGPALLVWNVTAFDLEDSTVRAHNGPAVSFLETSWSRISRSVLESRQEAMLAFASEAVDLIGNDMHAGTTAMRFESGAGDHWIEDNRVHRSETAIEILQEHRSSTIYDNVLKGETGIVVRQTPGPLLHGNQFVAHDAIILEAADEGMLLDTTIQATGTALRITDSDRVLVEGLKINGTARGIQILESDLTLVANLTYTGPGPAVEAEGGRMPVVVNGLIQLPAHEGQGIIMREVASPVVLDTETVAGKDAIIFDRTTDGAVIGGWISGALDTAIRLLDTTATLVAEAKVEASGQGIVVTGGGRHQVVENVFVWLHKNALHATGTTDLDFAFNTVERGSGIAVHDSRRPIIDRNTMNNTQVGVHLTKADGASIHGNTIHGTYGIKVEDHRSEEHLLVTGNTISGSTLSSEAVGLTTVDGLTMSGNVLFSQRGLILSDVTGGIVYDNYFDNGVDAVASGRLDVIWNIAPHPGTNIVGGSLLAGNWWHDYTGADADKDGIGDIHHGILPYEEEIGNMFPGGVSYGVEDEAPIVSNGTVPGTPTSSPDRHPAAEHLATLFGHHPVLDRILAAYA